MLCLGPSGAGKTPAYNKAFVEPISGGVESHNGNNPIILGDVTENGIFETL